MPEALARLDEIEAHIAEDTPNGAKETVARLLDRARQLATVPRSGRKVPDYQREDVRELLERPYRIIYRIKSGARRDLDCAALSPVATKPVEHHRAVAVDPTVSALSAAGR